MSSASSNCENAERLNNAYYNGYGERDTLLLRNSQKAKVSFLRPRVNLKIRFLWKIVLLVMALFFFSAAYVQLNDPDPYLWMPVYCFPFVINILFVLYIPQQGNVKFWTTFNFLLVIHICYCFTLGIWTIVTYFFYSHLANFNSEPSMNLEEAKEVFGLCLVTAWLAFLYNGNFLKFGKRGVTLGAMLTGLPILAWILVEVMQEEEDDNCTTSQ